MSHCYSTGWSSETTESWPHWVLVAWSHLWLRAVGIWSGSSVCVCCFVSSEFSHGHPPSLLPWHCWCDGTIPQGPGGQGLASCTHAIFLSAAAPPFSQVCLSTRSQPTHPKYAGSLLVAVPTPEMKAQSRKGCAAYVPADTTQQGLSRVTTQDPVAFP